VPETAALRLEKGREKEMSYLVLARKWRPQGFNDLIGQEPIVRVLKNAIEQGKIAHAYLFSGPRGVGKTSTARILAKALNCQGGPTASPCGTCIFCTSITDGSSMDVMEIDGASNNSVNDIRDLRERVKYVPSSGKYKVYIIDETHMLSDAAFNALLKTLEEPPPHVIFVLATTAPKKIPATVVSRCQHLPFRRIPGSRIRDRLKQIADSEGITISDTAIEMIAKAADGSLRDSLTILDQISSFSSDISEYDIKDLLGITDFGLLAGLSVALIEGNRENILKLTGELLERGTDIRSFAKELVQFFRDLLVASIVKKPEELLDLAKDEIDVMKNILIKTTEEQLSLILSELLRAEVDVRTSSAPRLAFEMSLIKASFLNKMKPVKKLLENLEELAGLRPDSRNTGTVFKRIEEDTQQKTDEDEQEATLSGKALQGDSLPEAAHQECNITSSEPQTISGEAWNRALKKMDPPLASKLSKADFIITGDKLVLTLNGGYAVFADSIRKNTELLEQILSEELGRKVSLQVETVKKKVVRKKDMEEEAMADPAIQEVLELFDGRIIDVIPAREQKK